jgi:hypothetical protein
MAVNSVCIYECYGLCRGLLDLYYFFIMELIVVLVLVVIALVFIVKKLFFKKKNCDKCMWNDDHSA